MVYEAQHRELNRTSVAAAPGCLDFMDYPVDKSMDYEAQHWGLNRTSVAATPGRLDFMNYPVDESMDYEARHREMDRTSSAATSGRRTSSQGSVLQSGVSVAARECLERPDSDFEVSDTRNIGIFRILSIGNFEILISGLQSSESFGIRCSGDLEVRISKTLILRILKLPNFVYLGLISSNLELQRSGLVPDALRITKNDRAKPGRREKFVFVFFNMKNKTH